MIILSVVTIPNRIDDFILTLDELLNSTKLPNFLYISISEFYPRLNLTLTELELIKLKEKLKTYPIPNKLVTYKKDIGPLMKLITPLTHHNLTKNDSIIIFDDDTGLFNTSIELLTNSLDDDKAIYGFVGIKEGKYLHGEYFSSGDYYPVEMLEGYRGVIYPLNVIDKTKMIQWCNYIIEEYDKINTIPLHDDYIFYFYCYLNNIESRIINIPTGTPDNLNYTPKENSNGIKMDLQCDDNLTYLESILSKIISF